MPFFNEFVDKLKEFPVLNSAMNTSTGVYQCVKASTPIVTRTLSTAEDAIKAAAYIAFPLTEQFKDPLELADKQLCKGLNILQQNVPIVTKEPGEIIEQTKDYVQPKLENIGTAAVVGASMLKTKTNYVLTTSCGKVAMSTLDVTSAMTDRAMDYVFPPKEGEEELHPHSNQYCEDKVYHVVHTVGTLGIKAGRKVSAAVRNNISNQQAPPQTYD